MSSCSPISIDPATGKIYYPCGLIANSMFNGKGKTNTQHRYNYSYLYKL